MPTGNPVADAELAVVVVDEAILALTNYQMADPISIFYSDRSSGVSSVYGRSSIVLANPLSLLAANGNRQLRMTGGAPMPTHGCHAWKWLPWRLAADMAKSADGGAAARHHRAQRFQPAGCICSRRCAPVPTARRASLSSCPII